MAGSSSTGGAGVAGAFVINIDSYNTSATIGDGAAINRNGEHLSIESRPVILTKDTLPLFMNNMKQRGYDFEFRPNSFSNTSLKAELIDNYLNTRTSWSVNDSIVVPFTVNSDPGSSASNRFMIVFGLPVQATIVKDGIVIFPNPVKGNSFNLQLGNMDKGRYTINLFNNPCFYTI